ncbi:SDR family NAD(P)-dependent oxidoreductase [Chitinophaga filiformis]|uniref:NADP-dependent 3-hydroxy acid dehydrogenase YdfG n=1 Tax=Chitinophaga filiformis TaxID=104663 RepID=A0A1G7MMD7_CHIFI|nr:SDR family NAD(P)-dependent oxidoreductase [Chitinophaga filiformis]SDF62922.1 NADP-dependent 3-hydroxy acid dehydrogenase YdfG [Chitinophaga filiformis]
MKQIILTGSASGFGLKAVKTLALKGHTVYATMRNVNSANAAAAQELKDWAKAQNVKVEVVEMDVTNTISVNNAIAEIVKKSGGRIDVLINNAGVSYYGLGEALTIEQTEQMYQVNTLGPERTMKAVLPYMHTQKEGLIINVTSVQSRNHVPSLSTYNGTKAALDAASVGYHYELKSSGIDVVTIQPGAYQTTDITNKSIVGKNNAVEAKYGADALDFKRALLQYFVPTPESGDPQEVADAMLKLVEQPKGERPLWTIVGGGPLAEKFEAINQSTKDIVEFNLSILPQLFPAK